MTKEPRRGYELQRVNPSQEVGLTSTDVNESRSSAGQTHFYVRWYVYDMDTPHLRTLNDLACEYPDCEPQVLYRQYHYQRLDALETEDGAPRLLFHVFPETAVTGTRVLDITEIEELPVPAVHRGEFEPELLRQYPTQEWNRVTASAENNRGYESDAVLYDTGIFETQGAGLCYSLDSAARVEYIISSQDLEQSLVAVLQYLDKKVPADQVESVYTVLSGANLENAIMNQHRRAERADPLGESMLTSRLTSVELTHDATDLRDQLDPVIRPFWLSQTTDGPDSYFDEDGTWEFVDRFD